MNFAIIICNIVDHKVYEARFKYVDRFKTRRWKAYFVKYIENDLLKIKYYDNILLQSYDKKHITKSISVFVDIF